MSLKPNDIIFNNSSIAFIPARGGSKRFPKKNIAKFFKKPLISYPIYEAIKSKVFTNVIVSTDDKQIMEIAKKYKADPVKRSKKNSDDNAHELEACREYFTNLSKKRIELPKYFCVIYPTAVLLKAKDFKNSFKAIKEGKEIDVVMGVSQFNYHPYKAMVNTKNGYLKPAFKKEVLLRSQKYKEMFASNGTFYWHKTKCFLEKKYYGHYAQKLKGYIIDNYVNMDIDYEKDLINLKKIFKN